MSDYSSDDRNRISRREGLMSAGKNDLYSLSPPFLVLHGDGSWRLVREIFPHNDGVGCIEPFAPELDGRPQSIVLQGSPWPVEEGVWELDYGVRIVAMEGLDFQLHPAWSLWTQWLRFLAQDLPLTLQ